MKVFTISKTDFNILLKKTSYKISDWMFSISRLIIKS